ncbi:chorismate-binding protein, partial [Staphylococcus haemolyticus]|uniref:chorismate-binding protein n=1 Tax=Staphylococcus haemolyticus TaxID=1283 RepID=UPI0021B45EB1
MNYQIFNNSLKHRAQNLIIVHLLPNHISTISNPRTIHLNNPFFIQTYKTLYQITSIVPAPLQAQTTLTHILKA